jgi:hypothetical protein
MVLLVLAIKNTVIKVRGKIAFASRLKTNNAMEGKNEYDEKGTAMKY